MANDPVLVDTSYWIEFFNRPGAQKARTVEGIVRDDRAATTGVVLSEVLLGTRTAREFSEVRAALAAVIWLETTQDVYVRADGLAFGLRRRGVTFPLPDCVIAAAAESTGCALLTLDGHFGEIARVSSLTMLDD